MLTCLKQMKIKLVPAKTKKDTKPRRYKEKPNVSFKSENI